MSVCLSSSTSLTQQQKASGLTHEQLQASWPSCSQPPNLPKYGIACEVSLLCTLLHEAEWRHVLVWFVVIIIIIICGVLGDGTAACVVQSLFSLDIWVSWLL
jgi:hypothetical protein